jgi:hypothetical protein
LLEGHTTLEGIPSDVTPAQVEAAYFGLASAGHGGARGVWGDGQSPQEQGGSGGDRSPRESREP